MSPFWICCLFDQYLSLAGASPHKNLISCRSAITVFCHVVFGPGFLLPGGIHLRATLVMLSYTVELYLTCLLSPVRYGGTPKRRLSLASDSSTPTPLQPVVLDKQLSRELGKTSLLLVTNYVKLLLICVCVCRDS